MKRAARHLRERALRGLAFACTIAVAGLAAADATPPAVAGKCSVQFFATSSLHDFEGEAPCSLLAIEPPDASGHYAARAEVEIAQLKTGISARDRKMREVFEAKRFPQVTATFTRVDAGALRSRAANALPFRIRVHGVERNVTPKLSKYSETAGKSARFRAEFDLTLREFGLEPPVAMGFIRVNNDVHVVVDVELSAKTPAAEKPAASKTPSR